MERAPEYTFEPHAYLADDEHGVSLQRSHYKRGDETLRLERHVRLSLPRRQDLGVLAPQR